MRKKLGHILGVWVVISLGGLTTAACGDDGDASGDSGGNAGASSGGNAQTGSGGSPTTGGGSMLSLAACNAYCQHYVQTCSTLSVCDQYCELVQSAVPAKCAPQYNQFFECGSTASLDCDEKLGNTPADGCGQDQIVTCLGGDGCNRFTSIDGLCEKAHPGLVGFLCTGADDAGCVPLDASDTESRSRCCPAP
jgi:hypothetical protein